MNTVLLILLFISISFLDYRHMIKKKMVKALVVYTSFLSLAFIISELHILGAEVIGLNHIVTYIIDLVRGAAAL